MTLTKKIQQLINLTQFDKFFMEQDKKVSVKLLSFDPEKIEQTISKLLNTKGAFYRPNVFEKEVLRELEYRNNTIH